MLIEQLAKNMDSVFVILGVLVLGLGVFYSFSFSGPPSSRLPGSIPWPGRRKELFPITRACIRAFTTGIQTLKDGYDTVNLLGHNSTRS